ncbi:hypothetical protein DAERI_060128 [Deinococcus aerius]|uniref:Uncharacterized protein n=1 Tax=Deinococcus aerius TaxID=200253 RepID=A0A2I9DI13_9DEIO|nr:hypothetical protein [Deinococcus aerius]GBF05868.1 hypothetical protein DAERI_060128 [Deinococcus aerius]
MREGWGRLWAYGAPHYVRGRTTLCGLSANGEALTLVAEPEWNHATKANPCKHCEKRLDAERRGGR